MLQANELLSDRGADYQATVTLTYDDRKRTRLRTRLESGEELAILIPRKTVLRDGDLLRTDSGWIVRVAAAAESLSMVRTGDDACTLARICYHLGNRHVPVEIGPGWVRYQHDHVLDDMVRGLGLAVVEESAPFQPEPGAYGGGHRHHH